MKIICYPSYTRRAAQLHGWGVLLLFVIAFVVVRLNQHTASIVGLFVSLFAFGLCLKVLPHAQSWNIGYWGERRVLKVLEDLPDRYTGVTNFVVPGTAQGDIDLLLIGPMGILVVEVKTYAGVIVYEKGRWWKRQTNGWKTRLPKNPSSQVHKNRKAILAYLKQEKERFPELTRLFIPVEPVLVFVGAEELDTRELDMVVLRYHLNNPG